MVHISHPKIIAHRGASAHLPENTSVAVMASIIAGSDIVEIDVQLTKDGEVVLFHDRDMSRIAGTNHAISDLNYDKIKELDVGSWKDPNYAHLKIPKLDQILQLVNNHPLIVEIKPDRTRSDHDRHLEEGVLDVLDSYNGLGPGYISVRDIPTLEWFRAHDDKYRLGLMQKSRSAQELFQLIEVFNLDIVQIRSQQFDSNDYNLLRKFNIESYVYWGDTPEEWQYLAGKHVDGILTNYPLELKTYFSLQQHTP